MPADPGRSGGGASAAESRGAAAPQASSGVEVAQAPESADRVDDAATHAASKLDLGTIRVQTRRILVGADVSRAGVVGDGIVEQHARDDRYVVYFELSISAREAGASAQAGDACRSVSFEDLRLEDNNGLIYVPIETLRPLRGELGSQRAVEGGVAFAVYNDSAPARLLIRMDTGSFAPLPEAVFQRSDE